MHPLISVRRARNDEGKSIEKFAAPELEKRPARRESHRSARLRAKTEKELVGDFAGDPDFMDVRRDWFREALAVMPRQ